MDGKQQKHWLSYMITFSVTENIVFIFKKNTVAVLEIEMKHGKDTACQFLCLLSSHKVQTAQKPLSMSRGSPYSWSPTH
jgi:hypothetical protein